MTNGMILLASGGVMLGLSVLFLILFLVSEKKKKYDVNMTLMLENDSTDVLNQSGRRRKTKSESSKTAATANAESTELMAATDTLPMNEQSTDTLLMEDDKTELINF